MSQIYIYECGLVHEMLKGARYHIHRADTVVLNKRLPQQPDNAQNASFGCALENQNLLIQDYSTHLLIQHSRMG
jgi:hypothetical protein